MYVLYGILISFIGGIKMADTITREEFINVLSLLSKEELDGVMLNSYLDLQYLNQSDLRELEYVTSMNILMDIFKLIENEQKIRQIEPLWRKAKRFAMRNSSTLKEIGKITACAGAGIILGQSLNIRK